MMEKPEDIVERLRKLTSPEAEALSDSYRLTEIIKLDPAGAILSAVEEEREAILKLAENFDTGCRPEYAPADYVDGYDAGVDDFSVFFSQTIRNRKGA